MTQRNEAAPGNVEAASAMPGAIRIVRVAGFDIFIHWTWLFIFTLLTWTLSANYLPAIYEDWSTRQYWLVGAATTLLFFTSVVIHELSHSVVARQRGLPVKSITLFIFGGVSSLGAEPRSAKDEFWIAIVGPLSSFGLAILFGAIWYVGQAQDQPLIYAPAGYLAYINVALGVFNLLPGFPLDGGRVLRSAVWGRRGNMLHATRVATNAGRFVALLLIGLGILTIFTLGTLGGFWFILIGWFLWNSAEASYQQQLLQSTLEGVTAGALVEPGAPSVPADLTLRQLAHDFILRENRRAYFVTTDVGDVLGLITMSDLRQTPEEEWERVTVYRAMTPRERLITVTAQTPAIDALQLMATNNINQAPVFRDGQLIGLLTRAALINAIQFRSQFQRTF
jgi:Zn-dependent protease/CBS domain-containing protein